MSYISGPFSKIYVFIYFQYCEAGSCGVPKLSRQGLNVGSSSCLSLRVMGLQMR